MSDAQRECADRARPPVSIGYDDALGALSAAYRSIAAAVADLDQSASIRPTLCAAWTVTDVLFHTLLDAQRALIAFVTPSYDVPDVDYVSYWRPWTAAGEDAARHARFVRLAAAAYAEPATLVKHWRTTTEAALRAAAAADPRARIETQGHTIAVPDFIATLAVEATVHCLDLGAHLEGADAPHDRALALVARTLDGLLGSTREAVGVSGSAWGDRTYALKGTGRTPLTEAEKRALGRLAERFPLFS